MNKNILLTEAQFKDYMRFQKRRLDEIDWKTSRSAYEKADMSKWQSIAYKAQELYDELQSEINNDYSTNNEFYKRNYNENSQAMKWFSMIGKFLEFANRKAEQIDNLEDLNDNNFKNQHDGMSDKEYYDMIDDKYNEFNNTHEALWTDDDFANSLSDKERDYFENQ